MEIQKRSQEDIDFHEYIRLADEQKNAGERWFETHSKSHTLSGISSLIWIWVFAAFIGFKHIENIWIPSTMLAIGIGTAIYVYVRIKQYNTQTKEQHKAIEERAKQITKLVQNASQAVENHVSHDARIYLHYSLMRRHYGIKSIEDYAKEKQTQS